MKNSGLMVYTVILKKILSNRVNQDCDASSLSVTSFFSKYTHLRDWFALKLDGITGGGPSFPSRRA